MFRSTLYEPRWNTSHKLLVIIAIIFVSSFIISFSFPHEIIPDVGRYTTRLFEALAKWFGDNVLGLKQPYTSALISDSTGFYLNALVLLILSIAGALCWVFFYKGKTNYNKILYWLTVICRYYLVMQLLAYAFGKIFKSQFYLPEPNTLYTTLGNTPRDLLYWSVMGTSRGYNIFMGCLELIAALLLLFRKTTLLGAIFSFGILLNIVSINFFFDISVKLYSLFLLLLTVIIIIPHVRRLKGLLISGQTKPGTTSRLPFRMPVLVYTIVKLVILIWIFTDALLPYIKSGNYNDDKYPRPEFHGVYTVSSFIMNKDTLPANTGNKFRWKRIFIHREGYFIIEFMNDDMLDIKMKTDNETHRILLLAYDSSRLQLNFTADKKGLTKVWGKINGNDVEAVLDKIDMSKLPLLQNEFHWTIDEIKHTENN